MIQWRNSTETYSKTMMKMKYRVTTTKQYRRDYRRISQSGNHDMRKLERVIIMIAKGMPLPQEYKNHQLHADMKGFEECHIAPDWLLIYQRYKEVLVLMLQRTGSHNDLF